MQWLSQNGFFALLLVAFVAMHLFGHGHGGHGGQGAHGRSRSAGSRDDTEPAHDHGEERGPASSAVDHDHSEAQQAPASSRDPVSRGRHSHGGAC